MLMPLYIKKRDGRVDEFNLEKIKKAINRAVSETKLDNQNEIVEKIYSGVKLKVGERFNGNIPNFTEIKQIVIDSSTEIGYFEVSNVYKNYRKTEKGKIDIDRYFTKDENYLPVQWEKSDIQIANDFGKTLFVQKNVEFPAYFSNLSRKIVASRYFYGDIKKTERETSFKQVVNRVSQTFAKWGLRQEYLDEKEAEIFKDELAYLTLTQRMAFNSPVWFNVGTDIYESTRSSDKKDGFIIRNDEAVEIPAGENHLYPQTSACFIQDVQDNMEDIMDLAKREAMLFKHGSGTGTDLSTLRSSREKLSGGGKPSGPLQYLVFYDKVAGIVKSGGKTRRAAKMNSLKITHPDIKEFIESKVKEQKKIELLMDNGIDGKEAIETVSFQNVNISVRANDEFMRAVENDLEWQTIPIHNKDMINDMPRYKAKELFRLIAEGTHKCGDPGIQFDDTMNKWHTCSNSGRINASNPCSEYNFLDNSSCNLASLNLRTFVNMDGSFNVKDFENAIRITAIAQDLEIDNSSFPTRKIAENSHKFRPLGMGYANLGSLVMSLGLAYDSDEARAIAAAITSLMTAKVYETSTEMAERLGSFEEFEKNKEPMLKVIKMHIEALEKIDRNKIPDGYREVYDASERIWDNVLKRGEKYGFRNAQATVLAPTGTIGFMMDCDTKGIEPEIGLVQTKLLAEGGILKIVNGTVKFALQKLGYNEEQIKRILEYIEKNETAEGSEIKDEHLAIFDCSNKPAHGKRTISTMGHIKMMAAVQPFLSGAISKTVNMPNEATVEDIENIYMEAWKLGLKAVAIYRDGSKRLQPLSFTKKKEQQTLRIPVRRRLPITRNSVTHKFNIAGHEGYLTAGLYEDGHLGELFITMSKEGSTVGGLMGSLANMTSMALQYGVPLKTIISKFKSQRFEPLGIVLEGRDDIKTASSIVDYIGNFLEKQFLINQEDSKFINKINEDDGKFINKINEEKEVLKEIVIRTENKEDKLENKNELENADVSVEDGGKFINKINEEKVSSKFENLEELGRFCPSCGSRMVRKGHCAEYCKCGYIELSGCGG